MITEYIKLPDKERLHDMKSIVDNVTGTLVLIPESHPDRVLLFHLMNCSDMCQFSTYIKYEDPAVMTIELGVPYDKFKNYLGEDHINIPVIDKDSVPDNTEKSINRATLIGFDREPI